MSGFNKKRGTILIFVILILAFYPIFVSASFSDVMEKIKTSFFGEGNLLTGMLTTRPTNVTAAIGNDDPQVLAIYGPNGGVTFDDEDVTEDGIVDLLVHFTVTDNNTWSDIDTSSANLTLSDSDNSASDIGYNTSCVNLGAIDSNTLNFSCSIEIHYWYPFDYWNITAGILDDSGKASTNHTNFTLGTTTAIIISPLTVTFAGLSLGAANVSSNNDPIIVNNTANTNVTSGNVKVKGYDLVGEEEEAYAILTGNFTMNRTDDCYGTQLVNNSATAIADTVVTATNRSVEGEGNETLYLCINEVPEGLYAQTYSTLNGTGWVIDVS